jgi:mannose-6-phosphate isomerase-like protein (cupin superfamily)
MAAISEVKKVNLAEKLGSFSEHWSPKVAGELNGQYVKLVKFQGEFLWHHHEHEDELFLVIEGHFRMYYRAASGEERSLEVGAGEFVIVPAGVEHKPFAAAEASVLLFEPAATLNTGNVENARTVRTLQHI